MPIPRIAPLLALAAAIAAPRAARAQEAEPSFSRDIAPFLAAKCLACHGPETAESGYSLANYAAALEPGDSGQPPIVPGNPDESRLLELVASSDPDQRMPKDDDPLDAADIARLKQWIASGAKFDGADPKAELASLLPAKTHPAAPEVYPRAIPVTALAFSPDGAELAVGGYHEITVWSIPEGRLIARIGNVAERTFGLDYTADGKQLLAASGSPGASGEVRLYDRATGAMTREIDRLSETPLDLARSPAGDRVAVSAADRSLRVYELSTGQRQLLIEGHADWVLDVAWSPDGQKLATCGRDKTVKVFSAVDGELLATYTRHGDVVFAATFTADGSQVASAGRDRRLQLWNVADGAMTSEVGGFGADVLAVARAGDQLVAAGAEGPVRVYRLAGDPKKPPELVRAQEGHADWVHRLAIDEGRMRLASGGHDGAVRLWNLADGQELLRFTAAPGR